MPPFFRLFCACLLLSLPLLGQIPIKPKEINISWENSSNCTGYSYSATLMVLPDSGIYSSLQSAIIDVYDKAFHSYTGNAMETNPDFSNIHDTSEYTPCRFPTESTDVGYSILCNSKDILSFHIYTSWSAGGGGMGMTSSLDCFNVDPRTMADIPFESLFKPQHLKKVNQLIRTRAADESCTDLNFTGADSAMFYFEGFGLTDSTLIVYYIIPNTSSRQFTDSMDIPFKELSRYFIYRRRK
jgi:hypothetical protein